jgi:hypothetical protein
VRILKYSQAEEEALKKMHAAGCMLSEMREVLPGRSIDAIRQQLSGMGLDIQREGTVDEAALARVLKLRRG